MDSSQLTTEQAAALRDKIGDLREYVLRLKKRIDENGFPQDDKLRRLVAKAEDALQHLWVELHYMSCGHGVGRPSPRDKK